MTKSGRLNRNSSMEEQGLCGEHPRAVQLGDDEHGSETGIGNHGEHVCRVGIGGIVIGLVYRPAIAAS